MAFFEKRSFQAGLNLWFDASFNDYVDFHGVLTDFIPTDEDCIKIGYAGNNNHELIVQQGGRTVRNVFDGELEPCEDDAAIDNLWISTPTMSRHKATRVETWGHRVEASTVEGKLGLIVALGPPGNRTEAAVSVAWSRGRDVEMTDSEYESDRSD